MPTQQSFRLGPTRPSTNSNAPPQVAQPSSRIRQTPEGNRLTQRIALLLGQRTSLNRVMIAVLGTAIILALIGFAAHALWIVAIILMALGIGYLIANNRRDHTETVNQRQEDETAAARNNLAQPHATPQ